MQYWGSKDSSLIVGQLILKAVREISMTGIYDRAKANYLNNVDGIQMSKYMAPVYKAIIRIAKEDPYQSTPILISLAAKEVTMPAGKPLPLITTAKKWLCHHGLNVGMVGIKRHAFGTVKGLF